MNILVEGSRGKSGTVQLITKAIADKGYSVVGKITGRNPLILYEGEEIPIIKIILAHI